MTVSRGGASIRVRVTVVAALAALLAAVAGSAVFVRVLRNSLEGGLVSTSRQDIRALETQLADGASPTSLVSPGDGDVVVQLIGADGSVVATDQPASAGHALVDGPGLDYGLRVPGQGDQYIVVATAVDEGDVRLIIAGRSTDQILRARTVALVLLAVAVPLAVALLALVVWMSVGRALRPVEAMRREAAVITSAQLDRRLPVPDGNDEITRLAATINDMLARIQLSHRLQRQFVSDASHELRSPLANVRQLAEVAQSYPETVTTAELSESVLAESIRLQRLVDALLLLARLDDRQPDVDSEPVDLDDLVLAEVARNPRNEVDVDLSHVSAGQVFGGPILLAQVVRNLFENAVRHARSRVAVTLFERDATVHLFIDDDGGGIEAADRDRVFDRFVRLDEARAREEGGAGLGLAIVRDIVALSGGTIAVEDAPLGGARFAVRFPAPAASEDPAGTR